MRLKIALHISVVRLRLSKIYLAYALTLTFGAAQSIQAESLVSNAQCVGTHTLSLMMALDCGYESPDDPECFRDHLALYSSDLPAFAAAERDILTWMTNYTEDRGYKAGGLFDEICEPALREIEDGTAIGNTLRPMQ